MIRIAINGFGRIGRQAFKIALINPRIKVVAVNDLAPVADLAYLLKHDSVYGLYKPSVQVKDKKLVVAGQAYPFYSVKEPADLPWSKLKVDVVLECTGAFTKKEDAEKHLKAGAKKVILSAMTKSEGVMTVVRGVNCSQAKGQKLVANASCTTNCAAPVMAVLEKAFGVDKALLTTVHAVTASQRIVDLPLASRREGRSALNNIIPTATGAARAVALTLPSLKNKFDGLSLRVPMVCGSLVDVVVLLKKKVTVTQVNGAFKKASKTFLKGILETTDEALVSSDIIGTPASAIVDLELTRVVGGNLVKVLAWYDNEWGYSHRLVEMIEKV